MSVITLPATAKAASSQIEFRLVRAQASIETIAGVSQVTSYPDRRWAARLLINPQWESNLRQWSLAVTQLSDITNVFALGPPHYDGPSTGYSGSAPTVNGADQLGLSLDVDNLELTTAVLLAGDYISFNTTSALGNSNRQLIQVAADVTSDGSGEATISLTVPIREAPADDAAVEIFSPTAFFALAQAEGGVSIDAAQFSPFVLEAMERIFP